MKAACVVRRVNPCGGSSKMAHEKPHKVRSALIQAELDRISAALPPLDSFSLPFKLAMQRLHFLSWQERILLLEQIQSRENFLSLGLAEIESFLYRSVHARLPDMARVWEQAERDAEFLRRFGAHFICVTEKEYPPLLREIYSAPFGLFVRGDFRGLCWPPVTVVGTRMPTWTGVRAAVRLAKEAADAGLSVVSGLARGVDAAAHRGALQSGVSPTIAVLPCGLDRIYPPSNAPLAAAMLDAGGCLVTEYPPGVSLDRYRFPERNRILAGFSKLTLVVEAPEKSGALITAELALGEGRDVAIAAACLGSSRNAGADALAREGACAVHNGDEVVALFKGAGAWNWVFETGSTARCSRRSFEWQ
jgi:DNA processing protein